MVHDDRGSLTVQRVSFDFRRENVQHEDGEARERGEDAEENLT